MHPAATTSLLYQVVLDDFSHPFPGFRICKVNHGEFDAQTRDDVRISVLVLDEVAIVAALFELILSDAFYTRRVLDVRVDVDEWLDAVFGPLRYHIVPVVVPFLIKLPVPDQSCSFWISVLTNPILHPDADHWQLLLLHHGVLLINEVLSTDDADDSTFQDELWQSLHRSDRL